MGSQLASCSVTVPAAEGTPGNWEAWVAREDANEVRVINGPEFKQRMMVDLTPTMLTKPHSIAFGNDLSTAYIAMRGTAPKYDDGGVVIVDVKTRKVTSQIPAHAEIVGIAVKPGSMPDAVWAVSGAGDSLKAISTTTIATYKVGASGAPSALVFSSDGSKAYVVSSGVMNMKSAVSVFDTGMKKFTGSYATGAGSAAAAISTDDKTLWVANSMDNSIEQLDLTATDLTMGVKSFATGVNGVASIALTKFYLIATSPGDMKIEFFSSKGDKAKELMLAGQPTAIAASPTCIRAYTIDKANNQFLQVNTPPADINMFSVAATGIDLMGMSPTGLAVKPAPSAM
jgi:hypothetical protein